MSMKSTVEELLELLVCIEVVEVKQRKDVACSYDLEHFLPVTHEEVVAMPTFGVRLLEWRLAGPSPFVTKLNSSWRISQKSSRRGR